jgi:uncharacterized protein YigA (DUF484 family)
VSQQTQSKPESSAILDDKLVAEYLEQNPDFFDRHANLLSKLEINHDSGAAISLIERQVFVLRDKNQRLESKLHELVSLARENEQLSRNILQLVVDLLWSDDIETLLGSVVDAMRHEFQVDFASVHLITDDKTLCEQMPQWYLHKDAERYQSIKSVLETNRPLCGRLSKEQIECLFVDHFEDVSSAALIPLVSGDVLGFIGLGGQSPDRFTPAMSTNFLHQIGELVSAAIGTYRG